MTYGQLHVQTCSLIWFLSIVRLTGTMQANSFGVSRRNKAFYNLVIDRPRVLGGTLTIPLDSTVKLVKSSSKDIEQNIIRLIYGSSGKTIALRASSLNDCKHWLAAITASLKSEECVLQISDQNAATMPSRPRVVKVAINSLPSRVNDNTGVVIGHVTQHAVNSSTSASKSSIPRCSGSRSTKFRHETTTSPQPTKIASLKCFLRRVFCQNTPSVIQLFITVGQAIAAAG